MRAPPVLRTLPDGRRLHFSDGPIDLIIEARGSADGVRAAYEAAGRRFIGLLDELCEELAALRAPAGPGAPALEGPCARRMGAAVASYGAEVFITPMAAVAGSVADEVLAAMTAAAELDLAYVNNGGDIALHLAAGQSITAGLVDRPDQPSLFGKASITSADGIGGIATSGWRGRSFSLGIADAVTVLARSAAEADAAATIIANEVDLPGDSRIERAPARDLQPDSDLGARLVTRSVPPLSDLDAARALAAGRARAETLRRRGLIVSAALHLQGHTVATARSGLAIHPPSEQDPQPREGKRHAG